MTEPLTAAPADASAPATTPAATPATAAARASKPNAYPVLEQLAALYPKLFGAVFLPMKRGIFQDLLAAHPQDFERDTLKAALAFHARSTRYLTVVGSGQQRHDLQGLPVEPMAPEHIHHALLEVFRRRQNRSHDRSPGRSQEDLSAKLIARMAQAFEASGLSRETYAERVRSKDDAANAMLDVALAQAAERAAKDEALLRAYEGSGQSMEKFADMYGLLPRVAATTLERAQQRRATSAASAY